jgi:hypothetical protein
MYTGSAQKNIQKRLSTKKKKKNKCQAFRIRKLKKQNWKPSTSRIKLTGKTISVLVRLLLPRKVLPLLVVIVS